MDVSTFISHRTTLTTDAGEIAYTEFGGTAGTTPAAQSPAAQSPGARLPAVQSPRAQLPTALFVHGLGTNGALWRHVIEQVADTTRCVAIDLPGHGGTPARDDLSAAALAGTLTELCDGLGLEQVDLVGNDTGGAVAQIFAGHHPGRIRTFTLTNCDTDGNFPPPEFAPIIDLAKQGQMAEILAGVVRDPGSWRTSPLVGGYEHPDVVPDESLACYLEPVGGTIEKARVFERMLASLDPADLSAVTGALRALTAPTLIVWGTGDAAFGVKWAHQLRDTIPGARDVVEIEGAKTFFPEERPGDLVPHLRSLWER
ncbi:MAG TPA: alpha/beta hydrolase [Trebonia sp.]